MLKTFLCTAAMFVSLLPLSTQATAREVISLDRDWKFQLGDNPEAVTPTFDDHTWSHVDVPHDYVIESAFTQTTPPGKRAHDHEYHASLPVQPAFYRKTLPIPPAAKGQRLWLEFDGVYSNSTYWLNGKEIGKERSGYSSSRFDITDAARPGEDNLLTVRVDPGYDGWWYEGGGIYRHTRLVIVNPLHITPTGVFITSSIPDAASGPTADATLSISTELTNETSSPESATLRSEILNKEGKVVATLDANQSLTPGAPAKLAQKIPLPTATLWSLENPYLYTLRTTLLVAGQPVDQVTTPFGVRSIRFDPSTGFYLNGKNVKLQGVNCHQDHAGVGVAMPDRLIEWRLERLKEMGCNAYRLSHNPVEPVTLDLCDRMGILVIAENRHPGDTFDDQVGPGTPSVEHRDLSKLILRDRNHPSIILWSLCNEQYKIQGKAAGADILRPMKQRVDELDGSRPVTAAMNGGWTEPEGFTSLLDVVGFNYTPSAYKSFHEKFPNKSIVATEIASEIGTRGVYTLEPWVVDKATYYGDKAKGHVTAYSINAGPSGQVVENAWPPIANNAYIAGGFVWAGFDYKGEPRPFGFPVINSHYGFMDVCGFPKDSYYYYKAAWTQSPVLHLFPHWNWPGKEGQEILVWIHTNCDEVELFLNGVSLGKQSGKPLHHLEWKVKYTPGTLTAKATYKGQPIETKVETTAAPAQIRLLPDRSDLTADNCDLSVVNVQILDAQGRLVPTASNKVTFTLSGPAKLIGVGNGDPSSHEPDKSPYRSAFNGLAQTLIQTTPTPGTITLTAQSEGLAPTTLTLTSK